MKTLLKVAGVLVLGASCGTSWGIDPDTSSLPSVETIVERALARAQKEPENDQAFKATYYFTRTKTTDYKNIRGNLKKRKERITVNEPAAEGFADPMAGRHTNAVASDFSMHKRDLLADTNVVKRFSFELRGRETIDGRPALVVDFKPASRKLPTPTLKDRFLNKAAGRIWVDEEEYVLVKAEAHLTGSVGLVGGLVGSVHKFNFSFGRERTEDGLWYTRLLTWHLEAREVIVERVIDCVETRSDVRKVK